MYWFANAVMDLDHVWPLLAAAVYCVPAEPKAVRACLPKAYAARQRRLHIIATLPITIRYMRLIDCQALFVL